MNSNVFIFLFLPVILALYLIFPFRGVALVFSILFYLWLDPLYFPIILFIAVLNYFAARLLHKRPGRILMLISVGLNVLILFFFKSLEANLLDPISVGGLEFNRPPIGISFITFTTIAYLLDTYFQRIKIQPNFFAYLDFQMFFPKVLAGPITRYSTFQKGVVERLVLSNFAAGPRRFARGLIKKVLLADVLGQVVGPIFALPAGQRSMLLAWIGLLFYTLQIFFDFSGYTDMALGIGQMFGVNLPENFNYPYIAKSIGEFWRRWHITLSNWFRDYIFFPVERKFRGRKYWNQAYNVLFVFLLTGLWHGLTVNFVIWGLIHGIAIVIENSRYGGMFLKKLPDSVQHIYALGVVIISWIFFRTGTLLEARKYLLSLVSFKRFMQELPVSQFQPIQGLTWTAFIVGIILCMPVSDWFSKRTGTLRSKFAWFQPALTIIGDLLLLAVFVFALSDQMAGSFASFLYGEF